ncbi:MAG: alpha/beta hydrolase [Patescibacteria group bacterium UBA2103]
MKKQIVVISGGSAYETHDGYLQALKEKEITLTRLRPGGWKMHLQSVLGDGYDILMPSMPCRDNAKYSEWKIMFEKIVPLLDEKVVCIGHSLGAIFLAKYLSEEKYQKEIKALFLVAAPFNSIEKDPYVDFNIENDLSLLREQVSDIYLYHSEDDQVVPFSHLSRYQELLPNARIRAFKDRGHFNENEFSEIIEDLKSLS